MIVWLAGCTTRSPTSRRCACTPRSPTRAGVLARRAVAAHRPRARARPLAGRPPHARAGRLRLLRQRPLRRHARPARLAVVAPRRPVRPLRNSLVLDERARLRRLLAVSGGAAADARHGFTDVVASTHAFGSWHTGALASHANQLAAMPSLHIAWAAWCTLALWRLSARALGARAGGRLSVPDGVRGARDRQPLRARHPRRAGRAGARVLLVALATALGARAGAGAHAHPAPRCAALRRPLRRRTACHKVVTKSKTGRLSAAPPQTRSERRALRRSAASGARTFCVCRVALRTCQTSTPTTIRCACPAPARRRSAEPGRARAARRAARATLRRRASAAGGARAAAPRRAARSSRTAGASRAVPAIAAAVARDEPAAPPPAPVDHVPRTAPRICQADVVYLRYLDVCLVLATAPFVLVGGLPVARLLVGAGAWLLTRAGTAFVHARARRVGRPEAPSRAAGRGDDGPRLARRAGGDPRALRRRQGRRHHGRRARAGGLHRLLRDVVRDARGSAAGRRPRPGGRAPHERPSRDPPTEAGAAARAPEASDEPRQDEHRSARC